MKKPLFSALYILSLLTAGLTIHQAFAERAPSVEPITEVSIEDNKPVDHSNGDVKGFDFESHQANHAEGRVPANIATKTDSHGPYSLVGPMIFLLALPIALWIVISKKMKNVDSGSQKVDYYSKTAQFKPFKTEYQSSEIEDEDQDYPKAS